MNDLRRWLDWATTETHVPERQRAARAPRGRDEYDALAWASALMANHAQEGGAVTSHRDIAWCLTHHPEAFRELALAFADAVERMRERVPVAERVPELLIHPEAYASLLDKFDMLCCPGCGCRHGAVHRQGCTAQPEWLRVLLGEIDAAERKRPVATLLYEGPISRCASCGVSGADSDLDHLADCPERLRQG